MRTKKLKFDAFPMAACHILLRRPYLYDYKMMHPPISNTYTFYKGQKRLTFDPLKDKPEPDANRKAQG